MILNNRNDTFFADRYSEISPRIEFLQAMEFDTDYAKETIQQLRTLLDEVEVHIISSEITTKLSEPSDKQ